jgi:hypothetical protein
MAELYEQEFTDADLNDLREAKTKLEYPSLAATIADMIGRPVEAGLKLLPKDWNNKVNEVAQAALLKGLEFSILTMNKAETRVSQDWLHKLVVVCSGVAGGAVGPASLPIELPISTCVILRSIADIARSEGHNTSLLEVRLACLEVLALGGKSVKDDAVESGYWMVRGALAKYIPDVVSTYLAGKGLTKEGTTPIVRFVTTIASRYSIVVTEEFAAKAIPVIGAVSGGAINYLFMHHFQEMARGHFIVKRLEKKYGTNLVEKAYKDLVI